MSKLFRTVGLCRSGNHAIISWLAYHFEKERVLFFNNINPEEKIFSSSNLKKYNRKLNRIKDHDPFIKIKLYDKYNNYDCLIHSYENRDLNSLKRNKDITLLIVRDPYNMTASRIKKLEEHKEQYWFSVDNEYKNMIKQYFNEYLNNTCFIKNKIIVNFNKWKEYKQYRKNLSKKLGLIFNDRGYCKMMTHGGGSSFEGIVKDTSELQVLDRWKDYIDNPSFRYILEDVEIKILSKEIFGEIIK